MKIPAGILDNNVEFFHAADGLRAFVNGELLQWKSLPRRVIDMVRKDLERHPEALDRLAHLPADEQLQVYAKCKFGALGLDEPDLTSCGQSNAEYWDCNCTSCPLKPVLRNSLEVAHGTLTHRELEVLKLIAKGLPGKIICDQIDIAESTFNTHKSAIFRKVGIHNNVEIALWATKNNLI